MDEVQVPPPPPRAQDGRGAPPPPQAREAQGAPPRLPPRNNGPQDRAAAGAARRFAGGAARFVAGQLFRAGAEEALKQFG